MKRLFSTFAVFILLMLAGCGQKEVEPVTEPFSYSGIFEYYEQTETGCNVTISTEQGLITIPYDVVIPDIEKVVPGYELTLSGDYYPEEMLYKGELFTVDNIPLEIQLGYTGEDLMSQQYNALYQSLLAQVDYSSIHNDGGRLTKYSSKLSYYIDQDESASYTNIVGQTSISEVSSSWSSMEYINRKTLDRYYIYNYGSWSHSRVDSAPFITFSLPVQDFTVDSYTLEGDRVVVSGTATPTKDTYLSYLLSKTFDGISDYEDRIAVTYTAKFSQADRSLKYAEYSVTSEEPLNMDGVNVNIDGLTITLSGIDFNDTKSVVIPDHVLAYAPEEVGEVVEASDIKLYESMLGMTAEEITPEFLSEFLGDPYETVPAGCDPDIIIQVATNIVMNMNMEEFMQLMQSDSLTPEEAFVTSVFSFSLQNGVE